MPRPPSPSRPAGGRGARVWVGALRVVVGVVVLVSAVGAVPLPTSSPSVPGSTGSASGVLGALLDAPAACAAPASDDMIAVAVAVDPGGVSGMAGGPETMCVTVPAGASGADVLVARARALGRPVPRYNSAGLLCSIDGQPATGCGERVDGAYRYWAYFLGTGGWTYAGTGPALRRANGGQLEGWRYVAGAGNATDPPPRTTASPSAVCPPPPPPTTAAPVVPLPTSPTPGPAPGPNAGPDGGSVMGGPGSRGSATVGGAGTASGGDGSDGGPAPDGGTGTSADGDGGAGDTAGDPTTGAGSGTGVGRGGDEGPSGDEVAGSPVVDTTPGGGPPAGALVAAVLVVILASGAVVRVRRRDAP